MNDPFAQRLHAVCTHSVAAGLSDCVPVTLILLTNGPKAIHVTIVTVYGYDSPILLLVFSVNLSPCLIYKLSFIIGMFV